MYRLLTLLILLAMLFVAFADLRVPARPSLDASQKVSVLTSGSPHEDVDSQIVAIGASGLHRAATERPRRLSPTIQHATQSSSHLTDPQLIAARSLAQRPIPHCCLPTNAIILPLLI